MVVRSAEIIAVGSELLTPHRADTNSLFLSARLNDLGIEVRAKAVVGDDRDDLTALLKQAMARADLVVITGGLGPTDDDVTRDAVAAALGLALIEDAGLVATLQARFASRGLAMPANNRRQAQVPQGATTLANTNGTAPGLWIETDGRLVVLLPGPPRELEPMFDTSVAARLARLCAGRKWRRRVLKLTGRAESQVDEAAQPIYAPWRSRPVPIFTTILASPGQVELHLAAAGADTALVDKLLDDAVTQLAGALTPYVFSVDGRQLEAVVGDLLKQRGLQIAAAESCSGGLVLGRLTDVPGSSAWVIGGVVAYSNDVKTEQLGVDARVLQAHGAVSQPVAVAMAEGVRKRFGADVGVSVTGIAGPAGGTAEKPVGTVVIAVAGDNPDVKAFRFIGDRKMVRQQSCAAALDMVRRSILES